MAGVSTKAIKSRIRSMESTKQITKAMEMVAASKLRKAQAQVLSSRPYFEILYATIHEIVEADRELSSAYLKERPVKKALYIVIAGDRGLAGGYNSNVLKLTMSQMAGKDAVVLPIGKKALEYFKLHKCEILTESYNEAEDLSMSDCFSVAKQICKQFMAGEFDEVHLAFTNFVSVLQQTPSVLKLLPLVHQKIGKNGKAAALRCMSRTVRLYSTQSFPSISAVCFTVHCVRAELLNKQPAVRQWTPQHKMRKR